MKLRAQMPRAALLLCCAVAFAVAVGGANADSIYSERADSKRAETLPAPGLTVLLGLSPGQKLVKLEGQVVTVEPISVPGPNRARNHAYDVYGCSDVVSEDPQFVYSGVLQGEIWVRGDCIGLAWTEVTTCLDNGGPVVINCSPRRYYGNGGWDNWSSAFGCPNNRPLRDWRTLAPYIRYHSLKGHESYFATSGDVVELYC